MTPRLTCSIPGGACALTLALLAACSTPSARASDSATVVANTPQDLTVTPDQRQRIHIVTVARSAFRPQIEATGNVAFNGDNSTQVLSPVSGPVTRIVAEPGAVVSKGQPLAYVSSPDFASAVAGYRKAQTAFRNAKRIADRDSALFKNDALARGDLEQAQSDLASADADVEAALQSIRSLGVEDAQIDAIRDGRPAPIEAIIRSPISGTVVEKLISPGQLLQAGTTPAFTVADLSTMWVMANVYAQDLVDVSVGQTADVISDASVTPLHGTVNYIAALADPGTKAVSVRIVTPNLNHILRRDMFVRVRINSSHEHTGILIPLSSLLRDDQNLPYVFVVVGANRFARRKIELGGRVGDQYEVTSGLMPGDQLVADGALFLQFAESQ